MPIQTEISEALDQEAASGDFNDFIRTYVRKRLTAALGLTREGKLPSIQDRIEAMAVQANQGCGQIYELFLERFSGMVDRAYPPGCLDRERAIAIANAVGGYATPEEIAQSQIEADEMGCCSHGLDPDCCPCGCGDLD